MGGVDLDNVIIKVLVICVYWEDVSECYVVIGGVYLYYD